MICLKKLLNEYWFFLPSILLLAGMFIAALCEGCSWFSHQDCPSPTQKTIVKTVGQTGCTLPPMPKSPAITRYEGDDCPAHLICFTIEHAAQLAARLDEEKRWRNSVKTQCATKPIDPKDPSR